jgi:diacylglycerol kinase family enzyme
MRRALILHYSGTARHGALQRSQRALESRGWRVFARETEWNEKEGVLLPSDVDPATFERVFVAGGDGTVRAVVAALAKRASEIPLALLPAGNANVLAVEFGIPRGAAAVEAALAGEVRAVDAFEVTADGARPRLGLAMVGIGVDGTITQVVHGLRRRFPTQQIYFVPSFGPGALYVAGFVRALFAPSEPLRVSVEGTPATLPYRHVWISNTANYGTGWSMTGKPASARGHAATDGVLDWTGSRRTSCFALSGLFANAARRRRSAGSDYGSGQRFVVESEQPFRWQMDGDPQPETRRLEVVVLPKAWRLWTRPG